MIINVACAVIAVLCMFFVGTLALSDLNIFYIIPEEVSFIGFLSSVFLLLLVSMSTLFK